MPPDLKLTIAGANSNAVSVTTSTIARALELIEPITSSEPGMTLYKHWVSILAERPVLIQWLNDVGGLGMSNIKDERTLLAAGINSVGPLSLGLVHGRVSDMLAFRYKQTNAAHSFVMNSKSRMAEQKNQLHTLLSLGYQHIESAEVFHEDFLDEMTLAHSRELGSTLIEQGAKAPTLFLLGQLTSWLTIHLQTYGERSMWSAKDWFSSTTTSSMAKH